MKKMLLLLVSGFLIMCMAGSAMAASSHLVNADTSAALTTGDFTLETGVPLNVHFVVTGIQDTDRGDDYTLSSDVVAMTDGCSDSDVEVTILDPTFTIPGLSASTEYECPNLISITSNSNVNGAVYQVTIRADGTIGSRTYEFTSTSNDFTSVPEFPTVALPVAALIGLVFIFGRKKEGL